MPSFAYSPTPLAYFGIESSGLDLAIDLLIVFVAVLYLALLFWTYADARRRIGDPMLVGSATAASLIFPFVGTIVYLVLRPPEYLDDVRERELEMQAAEARLYELGHLLCPYCDYRVERDFRRCPSCLRKLKEPCESCGRPLDQAWAICPYCEAEVAGASARRPRRRRSSSLEGGRSERSGPATRAGRAAVEEERQEAATAADGAVQPKRRGDDDPRTTPLSTTEPVVRPRRAH